MRHKETWDMRAEGPTEIHTFSYKYIKYISNNWFNFEYAASDLLQLSFESSGHYLFIFIIQTSFFQEGLQG